MSKIVSFACATLVAMVSFSLFATTYYVDASKEVSGDGLTPETAKHTIQEAVDLACAAGAGHTVSVAEGVYNEGVNVCHWDNREGRVIITNRVNLVASGRKEKTIIDGCGETMGVYIYYSTNSSLQKRPANSVVRGFTITNCRVIGTATGSALSMWMSYAVDCIFSNNVSHRGATYLGTAIRCLYVNNSLQNHSNAYGSAMMQTTCVNCVIVGQCGGNRLGCYGSKFYNCTVTGNDIVSYSTMGYGNFYNTVYINNKSQSLYDSNLRCYKCILSPNSTNYDKENSTVKTDVPEYCFVAPMFGDWRTTRALGAAEFGDAEYLAEVELPAALEEDRYLDFYGKPIPQTGAITCGAVQEICEAEGSLVTFDAPCEVEGIPLVVTNASMSAFNKYYWSDDYPGMIKFRRPDVAFERVVWYNVATNAATVSTGKLAPTLEGWTGFVPYPDLTNSITLLKANDIYYVDAVNGNDENDGKTRDTALASIQAAIGKLPGGSSKTYAKSTIVVAPGTYSNSVDSTADYVVNHFNRTPGATSGGWIYRNTRIVAEEGPEKTVIDGCGRTRCASDGIGLFLQGFTLTGGTGTDGSTVLGVGAVSYGILADCIISNNYVYSELTTGNITASMVRNGRVVRCRFADNRVNAYAGGVVMGSDVMDCELIESVPKAHRYSYVIGGGCKVLFSTVKGSCQGRSVYYYSILPGGLVLEKEGRAYYCYANGTKPITVEDTKAIAENCFVGKPGFINERIGDFRIRPGADVLGKATIDPAVYAPYAQLDLDGNPLKRDVLTGNTIGSHQLAEAGWTPPGLMMMFW